MFIQKVREIVCLCASSEKVEQIITVLLIAESFVRVFLYRVQLFCTFLSAVARK